MLWMSLDDVFPVVSIRAVSHATELTRSEILHRFRMFLGNVLQQVRLKLVLVTTMGTLVQLDSFVAVHMPLEGGFAFKTSRTFITSVRLFPYLFMD